MNRNMGRCLLGFGMVVLAPFTGSFGWIARLLGYMGISNGTAPWEENTWMQLAHKISTLAVAVFAVRQILALTGLFVLSGMAALLLESVFLISCAVCVGMGLFTRKKEDNE